MRFKQAWLYFSNHKGIRGGVLFLCIIIVSCWLLSINGIKENYEQVFAKITAKVSAQILDLLGIKAQATGNTITYGGFSINIGSACIAIYETIVFAAAIISSSIRFREKTVGVFIGIVAVWGTNFLRVIILFLTGFYFPNFFHVLHDHVIQAIFILFMVVLWISWVSRSSAKGNAEH